VGGVPADREAKATTAASSITGPQGEDNANNQRPTVHLLFVLFKHILRDISRLDIKTVGTVGYDLPVYNPAGELPKTTQAASELNRIVVLGLAPFDNMYGHT
jgi:hypothetical protein